MGGPLVTYEQQNIPVAIHPSSYGIPPSEYMIPGKTYVGRLPGRTRKAFVRKRPSAFPPALVVDQNVDSTLPIYPFGTPANMGMFSRARRDGYYVSYGPSTSRAKYVRTRVPDVIYTNAPPPSGRTATSVRQTCAACGRFRSARWEATHPLSPGVAASSSICARCQHDHTSSEERQPRPRHRRRNPHQHSRHCTDRTDESYCSLRDRRSPRRYRSDSRDYSRPRTSSRDNVRIVIANQPGERPKPRTRRSSSMDGVRVIRRTSVVEVPERVRSRSRTRSSSRAYYLEDGTAQYVEDLVLPRHRTKSRSLSRASYIEEVAPRIPRHKRRSSSRVQFVDDDDDEPVLVPRPRRISRRRAIYFDGPASFNISESEERSRSQPRPRSSHHEAEDPNVRVEPSEEAINPRYDLLSQGKKPYSDDNLAEDKPIPHQRLNSESTVTVSAPYVRRYYSLDEADLDYVHHGQHSDYATNDVSSDHGKTPRPAFRSISASPVAVHVQKPSGHKRTFSRSADSGYHDRTFAPTIDPPSPTAERVFDEPTTPQNKKRRRYRDDSTEDDHRPVAPMSFRHVRAPSPLNPHTESDYLSEMLRSSHITPPSEQTSIASRHGYARGPPSPPQSRSTSDAEDSAYRPPIYRDATAGGTEHGPANDQYSPVEDLYGNKIASYGYAPAEDLYGNKIGGSGYVSAEGLYEGEWPQSATAVEYNWMY